MSRIVVTGGAGFIGRRLVAKLLESPDASVAVVDNLHSAGRLPEEQASRTEFHSLDIRHADALCAAIRNCDVLYHLAGQANVLGSFQDPDYSFSTNVLGTYNVLRAAGRNGVRRIIFTSSREVYGNPASLPVGEDQPLAPMNPYGASKAAAEMYCRVCNTVPEVTVLRLANVYGPGDRRRVLPLFISAAVDGEPLTVYGGEQLLDFIWVDSVVDALVRVGLGTFIPGPMNIGSGQGISIKDLAARVLAKVGSSSRVELAPPRSFDVMHFVADIRRARAGFAFKPPPLLWNLEECIQWERDRAGRARCV